MLIAFLVGTTDTNFRGQIEHITRLSLMLNYVDNIEIVAGSEPSILDLLQRIDCLLRQHLGFETVVMRGLPGGKRRTAQVERATLTWRRQINPLEMH